MLTESFAFFSNFLELPFLRDSLYLLIWQKIDLLSNSSNNIFLGFSNSFFLSLPFSFIHLVAFRRLVFLGLESAFFTLFGYTFGTILAISCISFGFTDFFFFSPLFSSFLGVLILFRIIYSMTRENLMPLKGWFQPQYRIFFLTSFVLAWCEQVLSFQTNAFVSINSNTFEISFIFQNICYVFELFMGCIFFNFFYIVSLNAFKNIMGRLFSFQRSDKKVLNLTSFSLLVVASFYSVAFQFLDLCDARLGTARFEKYVESIEKGPALMTFLGRGNSLIEFSPDFFKSKTNSANAEENFEDRFNITLINSNLFPTLVENLNTIFKNDTGSPRDYSEIYKTLILYIKFQTFRDSMQEITLPNFDIMDYGYIVTFLEETEKFLIPESPEMKVGDGLRPPVPKIKVGVKPDSTPPLKIKAKPRYLFRISQKTNPLFPV